MAAAARQVCDADAAKQAGKTTVVFSVASLVPGGTVRAGRRQEQENQSRSETGPRVIFVKTPGSLPTKQMTTVDGWQAWISPSTAQANTGLAPFSIPLTLAPSGRASRAETRTVRIGTSAVGRIQDRLQPLGQHRRGALRARIENRSGRQSILRQAVPTRRRGQYCLARIAA